MAWVIGGVTLPYGPNRIDIGKPPKTEDFELDGDEPIVNVTAPATNDLMLYGSIIVPGGNKSTVNSTYISPLLALRGTSQAITDPSSVYSGTYFVADFKATDNSQGTTIRFDYVLALRVVTSVNIL